MSVIWDPDVTRMNLNMNEIQKNVQSMVLELFQALEKNLESNPMGGYQDAIELMDGIQDGRFFELPMDAQINKLLRINVTFFGRGERAIPLFEVGLLPEDFDTKFQNLYIRYRDSQELP
jgi:hypothetical protein